MKELEQKEVFVLPILYKECEIPLLLKDKIYADFRSSYKLGLGALLNRFTPRIKLDLFEGLMSGSSSKISACYAKNGHKTKKSIAMSWSRGWTALRFKTERTR